MADSSQNELTFTSEEERQNAIDALPDSLESESELDRIMAAPIREGDADETPADQTPAEETPAEAPEETKVESETKAAEERQPVMLSVSKDELPEGFDTVNAFIKSWKEKEALIERQTKFIQNKLEGTDDSTAAIRARAEKAEEELANLRKAMEDSSKAVPQDKPADKSAVPESRKKQILSLQAEIQELVKDPVENENAIWKKRSELDGLIVAENERLEAIVSQLTSQMTEAQSIANKANASVQTIAENSAKADRDKKRLEALNKEYQDIDTFAALPDNPEFKMARTSQEVEDEYLGWGAKVAGLYFGHRVDVNTEAGRKMMQKALTVLNGGAPDLTEKCGVAGIPVEPGEDVKKYLDICELLDYRDGYRRDVNGNYTRVTRFDPATGKDIPDVFPSLEAAYVYRKAKDGTYAARIRDAYIAGGSEMAKAASQADSGATEMSAADGVSQKDAGLGMSIDDAVKVLETTSEEEAYRQAKAGDTTLQDKLNEAMKLLGLSAA